MDPSPSPSPALAGIRASPTVIVAEPAWRRAGSCYARREYKRYADRHMTRIDQELRQRLQAAGFIKQPDEAGQTTRPP